MEVQFSQNQFPTHDTNPGGVTPNFVAKVGPEYGSVQELPGMSNFGRVGTANRRRVREAARLYTDVLTGKRERFWLNQAMHPTDDVFVERLNHWYPGIYPERSMALRETMGFSDYQALFTDVLDRKYYGWYNSFPMVYTPILKKQTLTDFRVVKRYILDGMVTPWTQVDPGTGAPMQSLQGPVPQGGSNLATASTAAITYQPAAYQSGCSINWRAFVNDDLGIFNDVSMRLAVEGNRGTSKFHTQQFFDTNGPSATLYTTGANTYHNIINTANGASSANPRLGAQGIMDGLKVLAGMLDSSGNPILVGGKVFLVYGPGDVAVVKNLMNSMTLNVANEGGSLTSANFPQQWLQVTNWLTADLVPIMDPYLPLVATNNVHSWILVVDPQSNNRPTVEFGTMRGFDTPQIFQRVPTMQRLNGGVEAMMGSFDNLNTDMKIIGVYGAAQIDGRATVGSNGSGT